MVTQNKVNFLVKSTRFLCKYLRYYFTALWLSVLSRKNIKDKIIIFIKYLRVKVMNNNYFKILDYFN
jgi:hypothetical protein